MSVDIRNTASATFDAASLSNASSGVTFNTALVRANIGCLSGITGLAVDPPVVDPANVFVTSAVIATDVTVELFSYNLAGSLVTRGDFPNSTMPGYSIFTSSVVNDPGTALTGSVIISVRFCRINALFGMPLSSSVAMGIRSIPPPALFLSETLGTGNLMLQYYSLGRVRWLLLADNRLSDLYAETGIARLGVLGGPSSIAVDSIFCGVAGIKSVGLGVASVMELIASRLRITCPEVTHVAVIEQSMPDLSLVGVGPRLGSVIPSPQLVLMASDFVLRTWQHQVVAGRITVSSRLGPFAARLVVYRCNIHALAAIQGAVLIAVRSASAFQLKSAAPVTRVAVVVVDTSVLVVAGEMAIFFEGAVLEDGYQLLPWVDSYLPVVMAEDLANSVVEDAADPMQRRYMNLTMSEWSATLSHFFLRPQFYSGATTETREAETGRRPLFLTSYAVFHYYAAALWGEYLVRKQQTSDAVLNKGEADPFYMPYFVPNYYFARRAPLSQCTVASFVMAELVTGQVNSSTSTVVGSDMVLLGCDEVLVVGCARCDQIVGVTLAVASSSIAAALTAYAPKSVAIASFLFPAKLSSRPSFRDAEQCVIGIFASQINLWRLPQALPIEPTAARPLGPLVIAIASWATTSGDTDTSIEPSTVLAFGQKQTDIAATLNTRIGSGSQCVILDAGIWVHPRYPSPLLLFYDVVRYRRLNVTSHTPTDSATAGQWTPAADLGALFTDAVGRRQWTPWSDVAVSKQPVVVGIPTNRSSANLFNISSPLVVIIASVAAEGVASVGRDDLKKGNSYFLANMTVNAAASVLRLGAIRAQKVSYHLAAIGNLRLLHLCDDGTKDTSFPGCDVAVLAAGNAGRHFVNAQSTSSKRPTLWTSPVDVLCPAFTHPTFSPYVEVRPTDLCAVAPPALQTNQFYLVNATLVLSYAGVNATVAGDAGFSPVWSAATLNCTRKLKMYAVVVGLDRPSLRQPLLSSTTVTTTGSRIVINTGGESALAASLFSWSADDASAPAGSPKPSSPRCPQDISPLATCGSDVDVTVVGLQVGLGALWAAGGLPSAFAAFVRPGLEATNASLLTPKGLDVAVDRAIQDMLQQHALAATAVTLDSPFRGGSRSEVPYNDKGGASRIAWGAPALISQTTWSHSINVLTFDNPPRFALLLLSSIVALTLRAGQSSFLGTSQPPVRIINLISSHQGPVSPWVNLRISSSIASVLVEVARQVGPLSSYVPPPDISPVAAVHVLLLQGPLFSDVNVSLSGSLVRLASQTVVLAARDGSLGVVAVPVSASAVLLTVLALQTYQFYSAFQLRDGEVTGIRMLVEQCSLVVHSVATGSAVALSTFASPSVMDRSQYPGAMNRVDVLLIDSELRIATTSYWNLTSTTRNLADEPLLLAMPDAGGSASLCVYGGGRVDYVSVVLHRCALWVSSPVNWDAVRENEARNYRDIPTATAVWSPLMQDIVVVLCNVLVVQRTLEPADKLLTNVAIVVNASSIKVGDSIPLRNVLVLSAVGAQSSVVLLAVNSSVIITDEGISDRAVVVIGPWGATSSYEPMDDAAVISLRRGQPALASVQDRTPSTFPRSIAAGFHIDGEVALWGWCAGFGVICAQHRAANSDCSVVVIRSDINVAQRAVAPLISVPFAVVSHVAGAQNRDGTILVEWSVVSVRAAAAHTVMVLSYAEMIVPREAVPEPPREVVLQLTDSVVRFDLLLAFQPTRLVRIAFITEMAGKSNALVARVFITVFTTANRTAADPVSAAAPPTDLVVVGSDHVDNVFEVANAVFFVLDLLSVVKLMHFEGDGGSRKVVAFRVAAVTELNGDMVAMLLTSKTFSSAPSLASWVSAASSYSSSSNGSRILECFGGKRIVDVDIIKYVHMPACLSVTADFSRSLSASCYRVGQNAVSVDQCTAAGDEDPGQWCSNPDLTQFYCENSAISMSPAVPNLASLRLAPTDASEWLGSPIGITPADVPDAWTNLLLMREGAVPPCKGRNRALLDPFYTRDAILFAPILSGIFANLSARSGAPFSPWPVCACICYLGDGGETRSLLPCNVALDVAGRRVAATRQVNSVVVAGQLSWTLRLQNIQLFNHFDDVFLGADTVDHFVSTAEFTRLETTLWIVSTVATALIPGLVGTSFAGVKLILESTRIALVPVGSVQHLLLTAEANASGEERTNVVDAVVDDAVNGLLASLAAQSSTPSAATWSDASGPIASANRYDTPSSSQKQSAAVKAYATSVGTAMRRVESQPSLSLMTAVYRSAAALLQGPAATPGGNDPSLGESSRAWSWLGAPRSTATWVVNMLLRPPPPPAPPMFTGVETMANAVVGSMTPLVDASVPLSQCEVGFQATITGGSAAAVRSGGGAMVPPLVAALKNSTSMAIGAQRVGLTQLTTFPVQADGTYLGVPLHLASVATTSRTHLPWYDVMFGASFWSLNPVSVLPIDWQWSQAQPAWFLSSSAMTCRAALASRLINASTDGLGSNVVDAASTSSAYARLLPWLLLNATSVNLTSEPDCQSVRITSMLSISAISSRPWMPPHKRTGTDTISANSRSGSPTTATLSSSVPSVSSSMSPRSFSSTTSLSTTASSSFSATSSSSLNATITHRRWVSHTPRRTGTSSLFAEQAAAPLPIPLSVIVSTVSATSSISVPGAMANPAVASSQARLTSLTTLFTCSFDHSDSLSAMESPLGLRIGAEIGAAYRGAIVGNAVLLAAAVLLVFILAAILTVVRGAGNDSESFVSRVLDSALDMHFPSIVIGPTAMLAQPSIAAAVSLALHGADRVWDPVIGTLTAVVWMWYPLVAWYATVWSFTLELAPLGITRELRAGRGTCMRPFLRYWLSSSHHWSRDNARPAFKRAFVLLFGDFSMPSYFAFDATSLTVLAMLDGLRYSHATVCIMQLGITTVVALLSCVLILARRPAFSRLNQLYLFVSALCLTLASALLFATICISFVASGNAVGAVLSTLEAGQYVLMVAVTVNSLKTLLDVVVLALWLWQRGRNRFSLWLTASSAERGRRLQLAADIARRRRAETLSGLQCATVDLRRPVAVDVQEDDAEEDARIAGLLSLNETQLMAELQAAPSELVAVVRTSGPRDGAATGVAAQPRLLRISEASSGGGGGVIVDDEDDDPAMAVSQRTTNRASQLRAPPDTRDSHIANATAARARSVIDGLTASSGRHPKAVRAAEKVAVPPPSCSQQDILAQLLDELDQVTGLTAHTASSSSATAAEDGASVIVPFFLSSRDATAAADVTAVNPLARVAAAPSEAAEQHAVSSSDLDAFLSQL
mgnify:FL=1